MSLAPGTRLGPYAITAQIGEGGMGEVYRATDTHLKRAVAIKVLPASVAGDRDRLARFQREAEVLAALNHPHIAGIYGLEKTADLTALVMELVEGDDLSQRIARGALPLEEALPVAKQIAEALEAAHEAGIIHRDLKPANIKVRADGTVKVLDFGLAKALDRSEGDGFSRRQAEAEASALQTITSPAMTQMGMILGTAAYMSPEQAKGRPVDRRTDIFAFGCVLYEMLTGRRAFDGDDVTEVLGAVMRLEPDWTRLPANCPPSIQRLLRLCLEKNVRNRRSSATDVRLDLEEAARGPQSVTPASTAPPRRARLPWIAAAVLLLSTVTLSLLYFRPEPPPEVMRFEMTPPPGRTVAPAQFAVSPDGKHVVFVAIPNPILFVRSIETGEARPLVGTNDAQSPFWSPDGRFVGYFTQGALKKVEISSGLVQTLCPAPGMPMGGTWSRAGVIVFGSAASAGLYRVAADGGTPSPLTTLRDGETVHHRPHFLPDGVHFLYTLQSTSPNVTGAYIGSLDGAPAPRILESDQKVELAPPDQLIFARENQLFAQPFDLGTLRTRGAPTRVADRMSVVANLGLWRGGAEFSVSSTGPLIVVHGGTGDDEFELGVFDRNGQQALGFDADRYVGVELSPDGNRLAVHRHTADGGDLWITDLQTKADRRFTFEPSEDAFSSVWSPDGTMIAFAALRSGRWGVYRKPANGGGTAELLYESATATIPMAWAPDGQAIVLVNYATVAQDLWILPLSGDRQPKVYLQTPTAEAHPQISPDGRWISYTSFSTSRVGMREVWVQSYPVPGIKYQVPLAFARQARWRADGKELIVVTSDALTAVPIESKGSALAFGTPTELFKATRFGVSSHRSEGFNFFEYDVSADGQTFVLPRELVSGSTLDVRPPMTVILNWRGLLGRK